MKRTKKMVAARRTLERRYRRMRAELDKSGAYEQLACTCKVDRLKLTTSSVPTGGLLGIPGFHMGKQYPAPKKSAEDFVGYKRITRIWGAGSIEEIVIKYDRQAAWLAPCRLEITPRDPTGLRSEDVRGTLEILPDFQIVDLELAFDFPDNSFVDIAFVERHAVFGKSRPRITGTRPTYSSYGRPVGSKSVKSYFKPPWLRLEFGFHRRDLKRFGIKDVFDFPKLVDVVPNHIFFGRLDRKLLVARLRRGGVRRKKICGILRDISKLRRNLTSQLAYLRRTARLTNARRLVQPMEEMNQVVRVALQTWAAQWSNAPARLGAPSDTRDSSAEGLRGDPR